MSTSRLTEDFVPTTYGELFEHYYEFIIRLVRSKGINRENAEDVAMSIIEKFVQHDVLNDYDPDRTFVHSGVERKAMFRTLLSGFVVSYVRHHVSTQQKRVAREGVSIDGTVADSEMRPNGFQSTFADFRYVETYDELEEFDIVRGVRRRLKDAKPRNSQDKADLTELFEVCFAQASAEGRVDMLDLAHHFGVSKTSIQNWMKRLRVEVTAAASDAERIAA